MTKSKKEDKANKKEETEEIPLIKRSISIGAMHATVEITSEDPIDTIEKLQKLAVKTINLYKR